VCDATGDDRNNEVWLIKKSPQKNARRKNSPGLFITKTNYKNA